MKKQDSSALFGVIGLGRFGSALARTLAEAGKEVIAVDCDEQKVKAIRKYTDYAFVVDDLSEEALTEVGIQNCGTVGICIGEQIDISILTSMLVLAVMILPTIVSVTITSLRAVPQEYYDGSLALGATPVTSIFKMNIRAAKSGIITGIVLGVGRAIGETMAIIMVSGNVPNMPNLFKSVRFLTTGIVSEMSYAAGLHRQSLFSIGLVLFVFIFIINLILNSILKKGAKAR